MPRQKKGEPGHELASLRWRQTMEAKYGGPEGLHKKMQETGAIGGHRGHTGGFASNVIGEDGLTGFERAKIAGAKGGRISRRTKKVVKDEQDQ